MVNWNPQVCTRCEILADKEETENWVDYTCPKCGKKWGKCKTIKQ